jgi:hypothetical protein
MKIKVIGSSSTGSEVEVAIFAKPLARRDLK